MARHRVLSLATPIQIRALREEARRGSTILPRQTTRGGRLCAFPRDPRQGKKKKPFPLPYTFYNKQIIFW
jgi:hypothetical protein